MVDVLALSRRDAGELPAHGVSIGEAFRADIMAVADRDPACLRMMEPLLYFKGFQALQAYRLSHWLLKAGRRDFALSLQSLASGAFGVDINPGARIGKGVFLDHATDLVVGETTERGDDRIECFPAAGRPPGARTGDICDSTRHTAASSAAPATIPRDLFIFGMRRHANNLNTEGLLPPRNASRIAPAGG